MNLNVRILKISIESEGYTVIDITNHIKNIVLEFKMNKGIVVIYTQEKGCALAEIEYEPELLADLEFLLEKLGCINANLCDIVLGRNIIVPVVNGSLFLGQFKNIVLIDTSRIPGQKSMVIVLEGVFKDS